MVATPLHSDFGLAAGTYRSTFIGEEKLLPCAFFLQVGGRGSVWFAVVAAMRQASIRATLLAGRALARRQHVARISRIEYSNPKHHLSSTLSSSPQLYQLGLASAPSRLTMRLSHSSYPNHQGSSR